MSERTCSVDGCGRGGKLTRGMCGKHYRYWLDHTPPEQRPLAPRFAVDFWDLVNKDGSVPAHCPELGHCWPWTGPTDAKGYGRWSKVIASRHSWTLANGPITDELWVLHHCDNPPCVRPDHLYLGTVVENVRDMVERGRAYVPPLKAVCDEGHLIAGDNLREYRAKSGRIVRMCRICDNKQSADRMRLARRGRPRSSRWLKPADKERIADLRREGLTQRKIAQETGHSRSCVQTILREAGL